MQTLITSFIVALTLMSAANGKPKKVSTSAPEAPAEKPRPVASQITLQVRTATSGLAVGATAAPSAKSTRTTVTHSSGVEIAVGNYGATPENVTVKWLWVGRYESTRNWFRTGDGAKTVSVHPKKTEAIIAEGAEIEQHDTKGKTSNFKSGGHLVGWVVTAHNPKGELVGIRSSDSYLDGFATTPPPKMRQ